MSLLPPAVARGSDEGCACTLGRHGTLASPPYHHHRQRMTDRLDARVLVAIGLFVIGLVLGKPLQQTPYRAAEIVVLLTAYGLSGGKVLRNAWRNVVRRKFFDENSLMTVATLGAIAIGELHEAVAVMLFYSIGEFLQDRAVRESRRSISALMSLRPDTVHLKMGDAVRDVLPEEVVPGSLIFVRPGERVPLDGLVVDGQSFVDTSPLTGEFVPRSVKPGSEVLAGTVNTSGLLTVQVTKPFAESSIARILELVENAATRKSSTERFIATFSRYYTPAVVGAAAALAIVPPLFAAGSGWSDWIYRALVLLVISCPCALVISVPLSYFSGLGAASRNGVLIKGASYLDVLTKVRTVVFDKTGTLTRGVFRVTEVVPASGFSKEELLHWAAVAEAQSRHPIAKSVLEAAGTPIDVSRVQECEEVAGCGVRARVDGRTILVGNDRLLRQENIPFVDDANVSDTVVHVAIDGAYAGHMVISDELRDDAEPTVRALRELGVRRMVMLTGDHEAVAAHVARRLGLDAVYANLSPEDKVSRLEELLASRQSSDERVAFVGDGINDAAVIRRADVGIAMGGLGSDAALEASDAVIMDDRLSRLPAALRIARITRRLVLQNIGLALGVKGLFVALGAAGLAGVWGAVIADVGVSLLAILNATRVLHVRYRDS